MKRFVDNVFMSMLSRVPTRLGQHALFLMKSRTDVADKWGYHIRPIHYYEPLPDFRSLSSQQCSIRRESPAVNFDIAGQLALLQRLTKYRSEVDGLATEASSTRINFRNDYFSRVDAAMYYALIRDLRPARVIEIGGGYSTQIAARALQQNSREGKTGKLLCIEPYPQARLTDRNLDCELVCQCVEQVPLEVFASLRANDILFIDSSHAVKFQGDVCREFLEILPRIGSGVWVHIHDIFFPYDYPAEWIVEQRLAFTEQYLLEAFLSYNHAFVVRIANHWLWRDYPHELDQLWPTAEISESSGCMSFWMQKT